LGFKAKYQEQNHTTLNIFSIIIKHTLNNTYANKHIICHVPQSIQPDSVQ